MTAGNAIDVAECRDALGKETRWSGLAAAAVLWPAMALPVGISTIMFSEPGIFACRISQ